ncbi:hypothetical protein SCLCIDRAFT_31898 [Scleroderma citrinum Foug A]|uniref:Uncharacterized protein n=1 Tax=Scleroderma citrinum Foug A TaxID=1036808 RepID=A0A0C3DAK4_9AGAM|nr:hypothetical protein SCLCIDRAFT_31898 [Scleroderma citrinum Foug A]
MPTSLDSTPTTTSEALNSTTSSKTAGGEGSGNEPGLDDTESYFSISSSSVPVNLPPTRSSALRPTPINLPLTFKQSVRKAIQQRLRRYAGKLDPNTSREIELGISDAIDLALRILERSHKQQNILPFTDTSTSVRLRSAVLSSVLRDVANNVLQGSLKAISFSGQRFLTVLSQGTAPKLMLTSHTMPPSYEMINLDVSSRAQSLLIPGGWDQDQD